MNIQNVDAIPEKYQSEHLFLLVGMNPLPNLVAAQLLARQKGHVWLLYSYGEKEERHSTKEFAENLEQALLQRRPDLKGIHLEAMDSSDNVAIEQRLCAILKKEGLKKDVGLNYTGATKPMSVHAYRVIEQACQDPVFSYLDPRKLLLRIDAKGAADPVTFPVIKTPSLRKKVSLTLTELVTLHNYERVKGGDGFASPQDNPDLANLVATLTELFNTELDFKKWQGWMKESCLLTLPKISGEFGAITAALHTFCGGKATPDYVAKKLLPNSPSNKQRLPNCAKWFNGLWFEAHASLLFEAAAKKYGMGDVDSDLDYQAEGFKDKLQLDAAAMLGYQLFALSITVSSNKGRAKEHLLEAYVRARQLGGDEARVGLVSFYTDPVRLERELSRQWDAKGRIKVFGPDDLPNLEENFLKWFENANP